MIKLKPILFEGFVSETIVKELEKAYSKHWNTNSVEMAIDRNGGPQKFYEQNQEVFDNITSDATEFKYLGSGAFGSAYSLGDKVLKISHSKNADRNDIIDYLLFDKKIKRGLHLPMVYLRGDFKGSFDSLTYTILEKFEVFPRKYSSVLDTILDMINYDSEGLRPSEIIREIQKDFSSKLSVMEQDLRLGSNWLNKLIQAVRLLNKQDIADLHSGNAGIRRNGAEGYIVFFD